jgi:ubiquitin-protein ligase
MDRRITRINKELKQLVNDPPDHIYVDFNEENITHLEVLFIGPRGTPYSRMFMRFTVDFGEEYPMKAPKIVFASSYNRKIHPNIFPGGWVCLSTLNVGDSSGWVPSINLSALLTTIYSMFTAEMITSDNTHEHEKSADFFPAVMYDTFFITSKLLRDEKNKALQEIMCDYVVTHNEWYIRKLQRLSDEYDGKKLQNYYLDQVADFGGLIVSFLDVIDQSMQT